MFTGIIQKQGYGVSFSKNETGARLVLKKPDDWVTKLGDSIAVQGACLTIAEQSDKNMSFDLMPETLKKTTFGTHDFATVNLEQAVGIGTKLDGHMVSGHIDVVGIVQEVREDQGEYVVRISFDAQYASFVIMKGSITVDGVSLTVTGVGENWLEVSLVPYTLEHTTLGNLEKDYHVNLEFDMIGKYINRYMETHYAGK